MKHLLAILSLFSVLSCSTYRHFENPVIRQGWADPTAIYDDATGYYYSISTGVNKPFFRSKDLCLWEKTDIKPYSDSAILKMKSSGPHIWAPQFAKIGNNYLIYVTVRSSAEDSRIIVLSSKTLTGPYEFANILTDSREDRNKRKSSPRMMNLQQIYRDDNGWPFFKHDEISGGRIRIR